MSNSSSGKQSSSNAQMHKLEKMPIKKGKKQKLYITYGNFKLNYNRNIYCLTISMRSSFVRLQWISILSTFSANNLYVVARVFFSSNVAFFIAKI